MYSPRFLITNKLVRLIGSIEASKEVIINKDLTQEVEKNLKDEAELQKIYYGSHIEGNELSLPQTKQILEGATNFTQNRDVQEIINYKRTLNLLDELCLQRREYLVDYLRDIHTTLSFNVLPPEKAGVIRISQVVVRDDETGEILMTPPPAVSIPFLLQEFFDWLNSEAARDIHPVIRAAIAHSIVIYIQPFVEQTSVVARMLASLILAREGYNPRGLIVFEQKVEEVFEEYFGTFFVRGNNEEIFMDDLTSVIEYFVEILSLEFEQVKSTFYAMKSISPSKFKVGEQVALSTRQMKLLDFISENGRAVMKELKLILPQVSDDTILRDLTALTKKGIIEKEGTTKASSYILKR